MHSSYDATAGAAYITVSSNDVARTVEVTPTVLVDLDALGVVVGVELLRPQEAVPVETITQQCHVLEKDRDELQKTLQHISQIAFQDSQARRDSPHSATPRWSGDGLVTA